MRNSFDTAADPSNRRPDLYGEPDISSRTKERSNSCAHPRKNTLYTFPEGSV
jgi:hypothetical protein